MKSRHFRCQVDRAASQWLVHADEGNHSGAPLPHWLARAVEGQCSGAICRHWDRVRSRDCPTFLYWMREPSTLACPALHPFPTKIRDFNVNCVTPKMHYFCIPLFAENTHSVLRYSKLICLLREHELPKLGLVHVFWFFNIYIIWQA